MRDISKRQKLLFTFTVLGVIAAIGIGFLVWKSQTTPKFTLPSTVSNKLLFTPYIPTKFPDKFVLDSTSVTTHEGALFFSMKNSATTITFSEQALPKNYELNTFYDSTIADPQRLSVKDGTAVYGKTYNNKGNIISYATPDNTWIILMSEGTVSKVTPTLLLNSLEPQK